MPGNAGDLLIDGVRANDIVPSACHLFRTDGPALAPLP
jgi:hypothetical protein